jgi:hypothetical protein
MWVFDGALLPQIIGILTANYVGLLQGICIMENPSTRERAAAHGSDNDRDRTCDGVGVDDGRKHYPIRDETPGRKSI